MADPEKLETKDQEVHEWLLNPPQSLISMGKRKRFGFLEGRRTTRLKTYELVSRLARARKPASIAGRDGKRNEGGNDSW